MKQVTDAAHESRASFKGCASLSALLIDSDGTDGLQSFGVSI